MKDPGNDVKVTASVL